MEARIRSDAARQRCALDCSGLDDLEALGELRIEGNLAMTSLSGFDALVEVETITISQNPALAVLDGFAALTEVGTLEIQESPALASIEGMALESAETLRITSGVMPNLKGLDALKTVSTLQIKGIEGLLDLGGLESLSTVTNIRVEENPSLLRLDGLQGLTTASGIFVEENPALHSVDALIASQGGDLVEILGALRIVDSPSLLTCDARAVYDELLEQPDVYCFAGNAEDGCSEDPDLCEGVMP